MISRFKSIRERLLINLPFTQDHFIVTQTYKKIIDQILQGYIYYLIGTSFIALTTYYVLLNSEHGPFLHVWIFLCLFSNLIKIWARNQYYTNSLKKPHSINLQRTTKLLMLGGLQGGLIWGIMGSLLVPETSYQIHVFCHLILFLVTSLGFAFGAPIPKIHTVFVLSALVPFGLHLMMSGKDFILLGITVFVYAGMMISLAHVYARHLSNSLSLQLQNERLLKKATFAQMKLEKTNNSLEKANKDLLTEVHLRKEAETQLVNLASYDVLTGLPNRRLFYKSLFEALENARQQQTSIALMFIDLDNFKMVNDYLGHDQGDKLLIRVAKRLKSNVRDTDIVSRLSGDEFTIIFTHPQSKEDMVLIARKLKGVLTEKFTLGKDQSVRTTVSIGISFYPLDTMEAESLIKCADMAMYKSKEEGGNRFHFYTPKLLKSLTQRHAIAQQGRWKL